MGQRSWLWEEVQLKKKKWRELCEAQGQYGENSEPITEGWTEA